MLMFNVTNLDYFATKLEGMAVRFHDEGDINTAKELSIISSNLKDISKDLLDELFHIKYRCNNSESINNEEDK